ncbi:helix-turn-helix domain-containing protein [Paenibacillus sp. FA6]|uniref:helix-turn-helix domain-containing protein n=1 Tax=Paenibacillus sp. FA6 TaxID=3413029 RepID=UPI003F656787
MELNELGSHIKMLRKKRGMTLMELETLSGVSNSYLSQIENGKFKPSTDILVKLAGPLRESPLNLIVKAGHVSKVIAGSDNLRHDAREILIRAKNQLTKDGELNPDAKINIESFLKANKITSITTDNLFDELEKIENNNDWTTVINIEGFSYGEILDKLDQLGLKRELSSPELNDLLANSHSLMYKGHTITDQDRKLITNFLDALFTNRE